MLSLKMLRGSYSGLRDLHSILLSASIARALFGNTDPMNRIMQIGGKLTVKVTGVYEDIPLNSQFHQLKFIAPFGLWVSDNDWIFKGAENDWSNHFLRIYAEIPAGNLASFRSGKCRDKRN